VYEREKGHVCRIICSYQVDGAAGLSCVLQKYADEFC
jgi:hypothetical protein